MVSAEAHPRFLADRVPLPDGDLHTLAAQAIGRDRTPNSPERAFTGVVTDLVIYRPVQGDHTVPPSGLSETCWHREDSSPGTAPRFATLIPPPQIPQAFGLERAGLLAASVVLLIHQDPQSGPQATIYEPAIPNGSITLEHRPRRIVFSMENEAPRYWLDALDLRRDLGSLDGKLLRFGPQGLLVDALNAVNFLGMQFRYVTNTAARILAPNCLPTERQHLLTELAESMTEFRTDLRCLRSYRGYLESADGQLAEISDEQLAANGWSRPDLIERLMRLHAAESLDVVIERFRALGRTPDDFPFPLGTLVETHDRLCSFGTLPRILPLTSGDLKKGETLAAHLEGICANPDMGRFLSAA